VNLIVTTPEVPFSYAEALSLWRRLVAGWASHLDPAGARTIMEGIRNGADVGGSYEGAIRMLGGIGSWLAYPQRPSQLEWAGETYDLEALLHRALVNGCNPASPGYWGAGKLRKDWDQRTVESAQVAYVAWQTRERIWAHLSAVEQGHVVDFLDRFGQRPSRWLNNWALFWVLNHAGRKALHSTFDQSILDDVIFNYLDKIYCGDGWYDDAPQRGARHFDNYQTWGFATHILEWALLDGSSVPERRDELLERVRAWMAHFPYFFAADGAFCEFGRSLTYKFGRLGAPLLAYRLGVWPHSVGMLKRLVSRHLRWYVERGAIRPDGTVRQSLTELGSPLVKETYISTGAPYWAMQVFAGLWSLPDDDPFWTANEEAIPAEQSNFVKVFPQPGWVITAKDGQITQYNAGSLDSRFGGRYAKLWYSTRTPFDIDTTADAPSVDSCLCLSDNGRRGQRTHILSKAVNRNWVRSRYIIPVDGHSHIVDTTIVILGDTHLCAHHITRHWATKKVIAEQGSASLGFNDGPVPATRVEDGWLFVESGNSVGIKALRGYSGTPRVRFEQSNIVYAKSSLAVLTTESLKQRQELICLVYAGYPPDLGRLPKIERAEWLRDGRFIAQVNGEIVVVPPIASSLRLLQYSWTSSRVWTTAQRIARRARKYILAVKDKLI